MRQRMGYSGLIAAAVILWPWALILLQVIGLALFGGSGEVYAGYALGYQFMLSFLWVVPAAVIALLISPFK